MAWATSFQRLSSSDVIFNLSCRFWMRVSTRCAISSGDGIFLLAPARALSESSIFMLEEEEGAGVFAATGLATASAPSTAAAAKARAKGEVVDNMAGLPILLRRFLTSRGR